MTVIARLNVDTFRSSKIGAYPSSEIRFTVTGFILRILNVAAGVLSPMIPVGRGTRRASAGSNPGIPDKTSATEPSFLRMISAEMSWITPCREADAISVWCLL